MKKLLLLALVVLASCGSTKADGPPDSPMNDVDKRVLAEMREENYPPLMKLDDFEVVATVRGLCQALAQDGGDLASFKGKTQELMSKDELPDAEQFASFDHAMTVATREFCPEFK